MVSEHGLGYLKGMCVMIIMEWALREQKML